MAKVIRKEMKASELPSTLAAELDATPDQIVRVTVDARPRRDAPCCWQLPRVPALPPGSAA
jgi:hypothetical protein